MIQRVQSVFLAAVALLMLLTLFFPLWEKNNSYFANDRSQGKPVMVGDRALLTAWQLIFYANGKAVSVQPVYYIGILAVLTAAVAVYSLFRYDNRRLQMGIGAINSLLIASTVSGMLLASGMGEKLFSQSLQGQFQAGFYLGWGAFLFNILANRFIRRDERLVRSADRLR